MTMHGPVPDDRTRRDVRAFKLDVTIFIVVNAVLLVIAGALLIAGFRFGGELWPYPVVMGLWAVRIAIEGHRAYRGRS
jgi:hypothetical protein